MGSAGQGAAAVSGVGTTPEEPPVRHMGPRDSSRSAVLAPRYARSWAVVVGINRYRSDAIRDLEYAVSDALGMARLLVAQLGFQHEHVFIALEPWPEAAVPFGVRAGEATKAVIESLLFTRLPELTGPDDRVLVFFAGHGERRRFPGSSEDAGYLIPCDAEAGQWHTCIDVEAVKRASNLCAAKHVFYLIDTCYSGLATARGDVRERRYEETMLTARARQVLTAGTAHQAVDDRGPQGHSLFTWYVLQGLAGGADLFDQGVITGSQLMVYVRDQVARAFGSAQMPDFGVLVGHESGGDFVFVEPQFRADDHLALGRGLVEVARRLGDAGRLRAALREFQSAIDLGATEATSAWRALGNVQLALGDVAAAASSLRQAVAFGDMSAALPLAMALARLRDTSAAVQSLDEFVAAQPDGLDAAWARPLAQHWRQSGGSRRLALLIGTGESASADMKEWRQLLLHTFGFCASDIRLVIGDDATFEGIVRALARLADDARPVDEVVVFFSGTGSFRRSMTNYRTRDGQQFVFMPADFRKQVLREETLVESLARIRGRDRLLIADVPHFALEPSRARQIGWRFIGACGRQGLSFEKLIDGRMRGVFTFHLLQVLAKAGPGGINQRECVEAVQAAMQKEQLDGAKPVSIGRASQKFWPAAGGASGPDPLWLYSLGLAVSWDELDDAALAVWQTMLGVDAAHAPPGSALALARTLSRRGRDAEALTAIDFAVAHGLSGDAEVRSLQIRLLARAGRAADARRTLDTWLSPAIGPASADASAGDAAALREACAPLLDLLVKDDRRALLVGVGRSTVNGAATDIAGVTQDLAAVRRMLVERCGFRDEAVVTLTDTQSRLSTVRQAFAELVAHAQHSACFFYFSGPGSVDPDGEPVLRLAGIEAADLPLTELATIAAPVRENLVTLVDSAFNVDEQDPRFADPAPTEGFAYWGFDSTIRRTGLSRYRIGRCSVYPASLRFTKRENTDGHAGRRGHKRVTAAFVSVARSRPVGGHWGAVTLGLASLERQLTQAGFVVLGGSGNGPLFRDRLVMAKLDAALDHRATALLREAAALLEKRRHVGGATDEGRVLLELGLARHALGENEAAAALLWDAIERIEGPPDRADAHRHLARLLLQDGQPATAVTHLQAAIADEPSRADAHYLLGLALRQLIDQDLNRRIETSWRTYLGLGAPGGHAEEVESYLAVQARQHPE